MSQHLGIYRNPVSIKQIRELELHSWHPRRMCHASHKNYYKLLCSVSWVPNEVFMVGPSL